MEGQWETQSRTDFPPYRGEIEFKRHGDLSPEHSQGCWRQFELKVLDLELQN